MIGFNISLILGRASFVFCNSALGPLVFLPPHIAFTDKYTLLHRTNSLLICYSFNGTFRGTIFRHFQLKNIFARFFVALVIYV